MRTMTSMRQDNRIDQDEAGRPGYSESGLGQYSLGRSFPEPSSELPEPDRDDATYRQHRALVDARIARSTTPRIIV